MARPQWQIDGMERLREKVATFPDEFLSAANNITSAQEVLIDSDHKLSLSKEGYTRPLKPEDDPKIYYIARYHEYETVVDTVNLWVREANSDVEVNRRTLRNAIDGLFRSGFPATMRQSDGYP